MTFAPFWTAHWIARKIMSESPPPSAPSTLPISAFDTPRATPMRCAVDVASEDRAGAVRAVAVPVAVALAGEVLLHELDAREGRVRRVDAGVEHGHDRTRAGERRGIRTDRRDAPCRRRAGGRLRDRFDQARRHRRRHRHHGLVSEQVRAFVMVDLDDVDRGFGRAAHAARARSRRVDCRTDRRPRSAAGPSGRCTSPLPTPFRIVAAGGSVPAVPWARDAYGVVEPRRERYPLDAAPHPRGARHLSAG